MVPSMLSGGVCSAVSAVNSTPGEAVDADGSVDSVAMRPVVEDGM